VEQPKRIGPFIAKESRGKCAGGCFGLGKGVCGLGRIGEGVAVPVSGCFADGYPGRGVVGIGIGGRGQAGDALAVIPLR